MLAIRCSKIHTVTKGTIDDGTILIEGSRIKAVGADIEIPDGVRVIQGEDLQACPGFLDAHTHVGLISEGDQNAGNDGNEMTNPVTPHVRAIDGVDTFDPAFSSVLEDGLTTVMIMPGSANPIGGQCSILKTWGKNLNDMLLVENAGMKMALGENPKRVYAAQKKTPFTRMGTAAVIRETLFKAQNYLKKKEKARTDEKKDFEPDFMMEALLPVITRQVKAHIHCHQAYDIMTALRLSDEFSLDITLEHCTEGHKITDEIKAREVPAVLSPMMHARLKVETAYRTFRNASILWRAGIPVSVSTDGLSQQARWLPINAGICVRYGLTPEEALESITINPARVMGLDDRLGSLEPGKDADVLVCHGHPLEAMTRSEFVIGGGKVVFERKES